MYNLKHFLSDTLGINEDGSVIIAKSLALPGWILGVDVDSTDNLLFYPVSEFVEK